MLMCHVVPRESFARRCFTNPLTNSNPSIPHISLSLMHPVELTCDSLREECGDGIDEIAQRVRCIVVLDRYVLRNISEAAYMTNMEYMKISDLLLAVTTVGITSSQAMAAGATSPQVTTNVVGASSEVTAANSPSAMTAAGTTSPQVAEVVDASSEATTTNSSSSGMTVADSTSWAQSASDSPSQAMTDGTEGGSFQAAGSTNTNQDVNEVHGLPQAEEGGEDLDPFPVSDPGMNMEESDLVKVLLESIGVEDKGDTTGGAVVPTTVPAAAMIVDGPSVGAADVTAIGGGDYPQDNLAFDITNPPDPSRTSAMSIDRAASPSAMSVEVPGSPLYDVQEDALIDGGSIGSFFDVAGVADVEMSPIGGTHAWAEGGFEDNGNYKVTVEQVARHDQETSTVQQAPRPSSRNSVHSETSASYQYDTFSFYAVPV